MKPSRTLLAFGFLITTSLVSAAPILTGILTLSEGARFCVVEEETEKDGPPPEWLALGAVFNGYRLSEFDPEEEVLTLRRGQEVMLLTLREAKIEPMELPPATALRTETDGNLQLLSNDQLHSMGLHRIEKNETLSMIASRTGASIRDIMTANKGLTPINLTPGRILSLRVGRPAPAQASVHPEAAAAPHAEPAAEPESTRNP